MCQIVMRWPDRHRKNETEAIFINWREIFISLSGRWDAWCVVWWHSLNSSPQGIRQPESRWFVWWGCCLPSGLGGGPDVFLKEFLDSWLRIDSIRSSRGVDCLRIAASLRADACNQGKLEGGRNSPSPVDPSKILSMYNSISLRSDARNEFMCHKLNFLCSDFRYGDCPSLVIQFWMPRFCSLHSGSEIMSPVFRSQIVEL